MTVNMTMTMTMTMTVMEPTTYTLCFVTCSQAMSAQAFAPSAEYSARSVAL